MGQAYMEETHVWIVRRFKKISEVFLLSREANYKYHIKTIYDQESTQDQMLE